MKAVTVKITLFTLLLLLVLVGFLAVAFKIGVFPSLPVVPEKKEVAKKEVEELTQGVVKTKEGTTVYYQRQLGCLVCHSDPKLKRVVGTKTLSFYVNPAEILSSVHTSIACTDCHPDFTYQAHPYETKQDYRKNAGLSCIRCKDHEKQYKAYLPSRHAELALSNDPKGGATCGDCHGSHNIKSLKKDQAYQKKFFFSAKEVCGKEGCHLTEYYNYNDYYHGRAYKTRAPDSPACWDCHSYHTVLPKKVTSSTISERNLPKTCARCHPDASPSIAGYAPLIHQPTKGLPVISGLQRFLAGLSKKAPEPVSSGLRGAGGLVEKIVQFFFPPSLRPKGK